MPRFDPHTFERLDQLIVGHAKFDAAYTAIDETVRDADHYTDKSLLPLIGPSRSGKSRLIEHYLAGLYPADLPAEAPRAVRYVVMPRSSRPKAMLMKIQRSLGHVFYATGTEDEMLIRLPPLLLSQGVKVLFIDELHHCLSRRGELNYDLADIFKVLLDEAQVTIVGAGLESAADVLQANEQLTGRCLQAIQLQRFDWTDPDSRSEFMGVVNAFLQGLPMLRMPSFDDEESCFRWYVACGGLVGYLHKILRKLLTLLQRENRCVVRLADLDCAHDASVYYRGAKLRPFDKDFAVSDIVTGLTHAARIGERRDPAELAAPVSTRRNRRAPGAAHG